MILVTVFTLANMLDGCKAWFKENERFTPTFHTNDIDMHRILREERPNVILTITPDGWHYWPQLRKLQARWRRMWLSYKKPEDISAYSLQYCNLSNVLGKDTTNPTISFFSSSYKSESRILRPLRSLQAQTYQDWEWVIVDDSDDNGETWAMLQKLKQKDHRIRTFTDGEHSGMIGQRKREAALLCTGVILCEVDHDDDFAPDVGERLVSEFRKNPEIKFIHSPWTEPYETNPAKTHIYEKGWGFGHGAYYKQYNKGTWENVVEPCPINAYTIRTLMAMPNHFRAWDREFYYKINGHNPGLNVCDDMEILTRSFLEGKFGVLHGGCRYWQYRNAGGNNFTRHRNKEIKLLNKELGTRYFDRVMRRCSDLGVWPVPESDNVEVPTIASHDDPNDEHSTWSPIDALTDEERWETGSQLVKNYRWMRGERYKNWKFGMIDRRADKVLGVRPETVTVIIATYDRPELLKRALQSVFAQTYDDIEVIVVGDGCPTLATSMERWKTERWLLDNDNVDKLHWWNLPEPTKGVGAMPRNYAAHMLCHTDWIAYLDDDNRWKPTHLQSLMRAVNKGTTRLRAQHGPHHRVMWAFSSMEIDEKKVLATQPAWGRVDTSSVLHRRELLKRYGNWRHCKDEGIRVPEYANGYANDWELVSRWVKAGEHWAASVECTNMYNCDLNNQTVDRILNMVPGDQHDVEEGVAIVDGAPLVSKLKPVKKVKKPAPVEQVVAAAPAAAAAAAAPADPAPAPVAAPVDPAPVAAPVAAPVDPAPVAAPTDPAPADPAPVAAPTDPAPAPVSAAAPAEPAPVAAAAAPAEPAPAPVAATAPADPAPVAAALREHALAPAVAA